MTPVYLTAAFFIGFCLGAWACFGVLWFVSRKYEEDKP